MKKKVRKNIGKFIGWSIRTFLISIIILTTFFIINALIPIIYENSYGDEIRLEHKNNIIGNTTDTITIATLYSNWAYNNIESLYSLKPLWTYLYYNNGSFTYFIRSSNAPWVIKYKLGNCGENAYYFVDMMNYTGIPARVVCVAEDHCWSEFQYNNHWLAVDTTQNLFIEDKYKFSKNKSWTYITARYLDGKKEDITKSYLNTNEITIKTTNNLLRNRLKINLLSPHLTDNNEDKYPTYREITSMRFNKDGVSNINLGSNQEIVIKYTLTLFLISFQKEFRIDTSNDKEVIVDFWEIINLKNIFNKYNLYSLIFVTLTIFLILVKFKIIKLNNNQNNQNN